MEKRARSIYRLSHQWKDPRWSYLEVLLYGVGCLMATYAIRPNVSDLAEGGCFVERRAGRLPVHGVVQVEFPRKAATVAMWRKRELSKWRRKIHTQVHMVVLCCKHLAMAPLPAACLLHPRSTMYIHYRGIPRYSAAWVLEALILWSVYKAS
jgi:hypothetical protein